jgi:hypothetical protein
MNGQTILVPVSLKFIVFCYGSFWERKDSRKHVDKTKRKEVFLIAPLQGIDFQ